MTSQCFSDILLPDIPGIVTLVGAGGKTSLMFKLAQEIIALGQSVLTTTSTKIFKPNLEQSLSIFCTDQPLQWLDDKKDILNSSKHITLAQREIANNKLQGLDPETIDVLWKTGRFDWILVEADGAAGRPIKAPADHEPVIPRLSQSVIAILGLKGFNLPLVEEWIFRPHIFSTLTGRNRGEIILFKDLVKVLTHKKGILKGTPRKSEKSIYLNQADNQKLFSLGKEFVRALKDSCPLFFSRYALGSLHSGMIHKT